MAARAVCNLLLISFSYTFLFPRISLLWFELIAEMCLLFRTRGNQINRLPSTSIGRSCSMNRAMFFASDGKKMTLYINSAYNSDTGKYQYLLPESSPLASWWARAQTLVTDHKLKVIITLITLLVLLFLLGLLLFYLLSPSTTTANSSPGLHLLPIKPDHQEDGLIYGKSY